MRKIMKIVLGLAIIMVIAGFIGTFFLKDNVIASNQNNSLFSRMSKNGSNINYENVNDNNDYDGNNINNYSRSGMMSNQFNSNKTYSNEKIDMETLEDIVKEYIDQYDESLIISDIFIFEDSDYYFSIMEEDTGLGAMELLVNPYTGNIYPEYGPNMMWNSKYGMHNNSGYGMMGNRGMMGGSYNNYSFYNEFEGNTISRIEANKLANEYMINNSSKKYNVSEDGHEFYGYYTFHVEEDNEVIGMMSVNGFTGDVWYHDWHGTLIEIVGSHEDEETHP